MRDIGLWNFGRAFLRLLTQEWLSVKRFSTRRAASVNIFRERVNVERDAKGKLTSASSKDGVSLKHAIERMSKSKGNGGDPDEMVEIYGADATRLFVYLRTPVENERVWHESGIEARLDFYSVCGGSCIKWHVIFNRSA